MKKNILGFISIFLLMTASVIIGNVISEKIREKKEKSKLIKADPKTIKKQVKET